MQANMCLTARDSAREGMWVVVDSVIHSPNTLLRYILIHPEGIRGVCNLVDSFVSMSLS